MKNQSTVDKLIRMRLRAMANAYILQEEDPSMKDVPFDDRFGMLVDAMYNSRQTNKVKTLIKAANLDQPEASILDIDYRSGRDLDKRMVKYLASCEYIYDAMNVTITGATGSGKTYLACALGMAAIKQYISVQYTLLSDLLIDLETAKENRNLNTAIKGYGKPKLLIIDEWLATTPTASEQQSLKALLNIRRGKGSIIFCSQFLKEGWYQQLGGTASTEAEAILDRIVHDSYDINITYKDPTNMKSMREVYSRRKIIV